MVDVIPGFTRQIVTSDAPQSRLSGSDIAQPYESLARGMESLSEGTSQVAVAGAEVAAAENLSKQKVTRNADGSVNVENPATAPLIFGQAGEVYQKAVMAGTIAQYDNQLSQQFADIHTKHPTDPAGFKAASDQFLQGVANSTPPLLRQAVMQRGNGIADPAFQRHHRPIGFARYREPAKVDPGPDR
jgi:hypothetical protein